MHDYAYLSNIYKGIFLKKKKVVPLYSLTSEKIPFFVIFTSEKHHFYFTDISLYFTGKM